jgi:hypothetical protein
LRTPDFARPWRSALRSLAASAWRPRVRCFRSIRRPRALGK